MMTQSVGGAKGKGDRNGPRGKTKERERERVRVSLKRLKITFWISWIRLSWRSRSRPRLETGDTIHREKMREREREREREKRRIPGDWQTV